MGLIDSLAGAAVQSITIESAVAPPVVLQPFAPPDPSAPPGSSGPSLLMRLLRPQITIAMPTGPIVISPGGPPPSFPWLGLALGAAWLVTAGLAAYGAAKLFAK